MKNVLRYAFLTTQFSTNAHAPGGVASYTRKMARLLASMGHDVVVFVPDPTRHDLVEQEGYQVLHVRCPGPGLIGRGLTRVLGRVGLRGMTIRHGLVKQANAMARAVKREHARHGFDVVHSCDYRGIGVSLPRLPGCTHVVRSSGAIDLILAADNRASKLTQVQVKLEHETVRRADIVIAPSQLVTDHYQKTLGRTVHLVRPPAMLDEISVDATPTWLPPRYLVHFAGTLGYLKGTHRVAKALAIALETEPDVCILCIGRLSEEFFHSLKGILPSSAGRNLLFSYPLAKQTLYPVVKHACAAVLPSRVDNVPNTLVESLLLGTPVIVTRGASMEEVVEPGNGAAVVAADDPAALADAMIAAWTGALGRAETPWLETPKGAPFRPEAAVRAHLEAIGRVAES